MNDLLRQFIEKVQQRNIAEPEFLQAVAEVAESLIPYIDKHPKYRNNKILERIVEPERVIIFRVPWLNDKGEVEVNRGFRIQMNSAIGPYKGGLRFHPSVTLSVLKFLAFEQVFKNSLTGLPMGGGKGGSDFDPKNRSDNEVMKFCQSFMTELYRHVGADIDIPAGDIGVGKREIGYLFGQYKRIKGEFSGVLTGKGYEWGGSLIRPEATGYGLVYFVEEILKTRGDTLVGKKITISGSGNVAQYAAEKCIAKGAKVLTMSDSDGFIYDPDGIDLERLQFIKTLKDNQRGRISEYAAEFNCGYFKGERPWKIKCDIALPNATQNELNGDDAIALIENGCFCVAEGANMPCTPEAVAAFNQAHVFYAPGKAANAGGVAVSGLEMSQNSLRFSWTRDEVDNKLKDIMKQIHRICVKYGKEENGHINYEKGANIGGFVKIADSMLAQGLV
ncbi:NADP-specific glutamate dehydrogenase [Agriterribacter sp.]|uniref:NADP-specific glutamate dehydrogenase n=1 Tax=Agriterribacter sp. TaxID=2821509 RepID=UPI002C91A477|nr:NADP-specific glutamate dehydrogenase [Agriterribacter sp.]HRO47105.1 NADP-specific glutamate dehydrogenase [Agriterribacter sp.]HRQ17862.1 NADP-specific glutamate dehydrogenase [Agriterribacter sp.]